MTTVTGQQRISFTGRLVGSDQERITTRFSIRSEEVSEAPSIESHLELSSGVSCDIPHIASQNQ